MAGFPHVVSSLALLLGSIEPLPAPVVAPAIVPRVPILKYHVIADPPATAAWPQLYVSPSELEAQVDWLDRHGYEAVTLSQVWANWHSRGALPERPVVFTFDDGHRSHVTAALPILRRRGWPAVLNPKVGKLEPGASRSGTCASCSRPAGSSARTRSRTPTCARSTTTPSSAR